MKDLYTFLTAELEFKMLSPAYMNVSGLIPHTEIKSVQCIGVGGIICMAKDIGHIVCMAGFRYIPRHIPRCRLRHYISGCP